MTRMRGNQGKGVSNKLGQVIKTATDVRDDLRTALSLLECMILAMESGERMPSKGPYYPEIAGMVRDIVKKSCNALDETNLDGKRA